MMTAEDAKEEDKKGRNHGWAQIDTDEDLE
jgi:hypothetical protein